MSVAKTEKTGFIVRLKKLYRGVLSEMKKVHWPSRKELTAFTVVVILSVVLVGAFVWVIDIGVGKVLNFLIMR